MAFFNSFTNSIRQKWLQFFQANREWLLLHMKTDSVYTPDGGKRPSSHLILGVVNALEPKLAQLMLPFSRLNSDPDSLIEVLDLHFDPDIALGNRFIPPAETEETPPAQINPQESAVTPDDGSEDETLTIPYPNNFEMDSDLETSVVSRSDDFGDLSLNNDDDDFGDISFDSSTGSVESLDEQMLDDLNAPDENEFQDVLSDVWNPESAQQNQETNDLLGEELPSGVFDESEMSRLFPNA